MCAYLVDVVSPHGGGQPRRQTCRGSTTTVHVSSVRIENTIMRRSYYFSLSPLVAPIVRARMVARDAGLLGGVDWAVGVGRGVVGKPDDPRGVDDEVATHLVEVLVVLDRVHLVPLRYAGERTLRPQLPV